MELAVDLHIHSALSPCADDEMTPNNIINMAVLKELDIISVTDHNNASNLPALYEAAVKKGIMLLPGIEVQTREEVHVLCYFKNIVTAVEFGNIIYNKLPDVKNNEELFGKQLIFNSSDEITGKIDKLLLSSAQITIMQIVDMVNKLDGTCIPAHIDRQAYSIISNLGFIPPDLKFGAIEISKNYDIKSAPDLISSIRGLRVINSSDAHYLCDISEREHYITVDNLTMGNIFKYLRGF